MNKAQLALKRAVMNGKPIDWDKIAPPKPTPRDDFSDVKRPEVPKGGPIHDPWGLSKLD